MEILQEGLFYAFGRDIKYRPVFVINLYKVDLNKYKLEDIMAAFSYLTDIVKKKMLMPGLIENWIVIIDFNNISASAIPITMIK